MLIEIHLLQNHAPSNLNRDDTGSPKECIFGGVRRARISSQCLKRSIRTSTVFHDGLAGHPLASRTRKLPGEVRNKLVARGLDPELADAAAAKVAAFGGKGEPKRLQTAQLMFLTDDEVETVATVMEEAAKQAKTAKRIETLKADDLQKEVGQRSRHPMTVDVALFGRMTTSSAFRDVEAAMQVAHAISTHRVDHEFDFFTAVDDLADPHEDEDGKGAGMMGDVEFNSACYYKYFSLDVDAFAENLLGEKLKDADRADVARVRDIVQATVSAFLKSAVHTTPSGKQNTFAAHQLPDVVLVDVRPVRTPVSYANAFVKPARTSGTHDLVQSSTQQLVEHVDRVNRRFSLEATHRLWLKDNGIAEPGGGVTTCDTLDELIGKLEEAVRDGLTS